MQNYCVHVFTTHKNYDRCLSIENTWGKHVENVFFYTDRKIEKYNYLHCTDQDDYLSHVYKNFYAIEYANKNLSNFDWHFFIGDDTFIYNYNLEKLLKTLWIEDLTVYGQKENTWKNDKSLFYIIGGPGILMSNSTLNFFVKNNKFSNNELNNFNFSDVAIGVICRDNKINMESVFGFFNDPPENYRINNPQNFICFHYIKTKEQFDKLYSSYKQV